MNTIHYISRSVPLNYKLKKINYENDPLVKNKVLRISALKLILEQIVYNINEINIK